MLDGVQVLADAVFDKGELEPLVVAERPLVHDALQGGEPGQPGGAGTGLSPMMRKYTFCSAHERTVHGLQLAVGEVAANS